ncbi:MAG: NAD-binding oxidoreductase [Planctomycetes bacterium]|nr:NAD-binding oxidoreductase [Planctomycetota bacterium]
MTQAQGPAFHPVAISETGPATRELVRLVLAGPPAELLAAYTSPGQYMQIREGEGKPGFFAIACGPGQDRIEFLIKRGSPLADAIAAKRAGEHLSISAPAGKGYPMAEARGRDVVLFAAGSGIAPLRAVIHAMLKDRGAFKRVRLFYGARSAEAFAFAEEIEAWGSAGIEVTRACSQPGAQGWTGSCGHVQDAFRAARLELDSGACVFACGMKGMVEGVKAACEACGVPAARVFQNF